MHRIIKEDLENIANAVGEGARSLEGKTVLISGGAGFLGSYLVGTLFLLNQTVLKKPCRVISVDNYSTGAKSNFLEKISDERIRHIEADIAKPFSINEPVDYIVHAAGFASPVYYKKYPLETISAAIEGAKNLLELAREKTVTSFLLFSSSEVYGDPDPNFIPTPETYKGNVSSIGPRACYDESKRLAETISMAYHTVHGIPVKIVRPFNVYGPGMRIDDYRVVPMFITRALRGEPLPVHGGGNQTRTFCYVSDALAGFFKVLLSDKNGEVYNVGIERPEINMATLADLIAGHFGNKARAQLVEYPQSYPADEPNRRCPDLTKIKRELGYLPEVELEHGLKRTIEWYRGVLS